MVKRVLSLVFIILLAYATIPLILEFSQREELNGVAAEYLKHGPDNLGAANIVTSVVVTYRGLDTLGEIAVLFTATAGVGLLLRRRKEEVTSERETRRPASEILSTASGFLMPLLLIAGVYIFVHGHLTPGGGFQGGVVIASAFLLLMLSDFSLELNHRLLNLVESLSGVAYLVIGLLGVYLAGGFLDSRILPSGEFGMLLSAGAIPIIYSLIGLKVGSELTAVLEHLKGSHRR